MFIVVADIQLSQLFRMYRELSLLMLCCFFFAISFQLRSSTFKRMGVRDPKDAVLDGTTHEPREEDVNAWRMHLRERQYLNPTVTNLTTFKSVSGEELCEELLNMTDIGMRRRWFIMNKLFGNVAGASEELPRPIFTNETEREAYDDISNKTKDQIRELVENMILNINSDSTRFELQEEWASLQKKTKPFLVSFYNDVSELINMQGHFLVDTHEHSDSDEE